ncbi:MAG: formyltransferase family protein [Actinomycetota bacterium]
MRIGFIASHNGSALRAVLAAHAAGRTECAPVAVISNNSSSGALHAGSTAGLPAYHLSSKTHSNAEQLDAAIRAALAENDVTHVMLSGYLKKLGAQTLFRFRARVLNVHPSLLPAFGGPGMWGRHVHEAVVAARSAETGATVHLVDADYDTGPIVKQRRVDVLPTDRWSDLADRVAAIEGQLVVDTLNEIATGRIDLDAVWTARGV